MKVLEKFCVGCDLSQELWAGCAGVQAVSEKVAMQWHWRKQPHWENVTPVRKWQRLWRGLAAHLVNPFQRRNGGEFLTGSLLCLCSWLKCRLLGTTPDSMIPFLCGLGWSPGMAQIIRVHWPAGHILGNIGQGWIRQSWLIPPWDTGIGKEASKLGCLIFVTISEGWMESRLP